MWSISSGGLVAESPTIALLAFIRNAAMVTFERESVNAGAKLHRLAGGKMHQRGGGEAPEDGFVWRALRLGWIVGRRVGVVAA